MKEALTQLESIISQSATTVPRFPPTSRYATTLIVTLDRSDRPSIPYLTRRFVPGSNRFALIGEHAVEQGDRLDLIAHRRYGDATLYWRVCDANGGIRPDELTAIVGRRLRITLPEGIPGSGADDA